MCNKLNFSGITALSILILWLCFVAVLGSSLFEEVYKSSCTPLTLPLVVWAFILGCGGMIVFAIFRGFDGLRVTRSSRLSASTPNSFVLYVAHSFLCFLCLVSTTLAFSNLRAAAVECDAYRPPVSIVLICICVNTLNGFLSGEHLFKNQNTVDNVESEIAKLIDTPSTIDTTIIYQTVAVQPKTE
jgi:hypothetical protein